MGDRYTTEVRVRWSDLDAFGHVNNARTLTLLEEARVDWLFTEAARQGIDKLTEGIVVSHMDIHYRRSIGFGDPALVSMEVERLGPASVKIAYQVTVRGVPAVQASTTLVPVDPVTFRPRRFDPAEREFLARYLVTAP